MITLAAVVLLRIGSADAQAPAELLRTDSRAPYVHRLTLYDEDGQAIDPRADDARPYSPRATCSKCHEYATISTGWHFNASVAGSGESPADPGRRGEPWIFVDGRTGTQIPLSYRSWPGTWRPQVLGLTNWDFVERFGRQIPGGGVGEPSGEVLRAAPEQARWNISGKLEIDCMVCHSNDGRHDPAETQRQLARENLRWAPTAALGLAVIRGDAKTLPDDFDPLAPPSPDYPDRALPKPAYDLSRFDADDRVLFDITRRPSVDRCYACHSWREVGPGAPEAHQAGVDVHLAKGMTCVDCHRHGIDHAMVRGFEGEAQHSADVTAGTLTCAGCHLGDPDSALSVGRLGGPLPAPRPVHAGLPPLHLRELTCTACHSGAWPEEYTRRVQTSLAHGLGVPSKTRREDDPPQIVEPVFARQSDGTIAPYRMLWPALWGTLRDGRVEPLRFDQVQKAADSVFGKARAGAAAPTSAPGNEQAAKLLDALASVVGAGAEPVYIRDGLLYRRGSEGRLSSSPCDGPGPYLWPLAHDVRPASRALGAGGCTDCHAAGAPIFAGSIDPDGVGADTSRADAAPSRRTINVMHDLHGYSNTLARLFAAGFASRTAFKGFGFACVAVVAIVLLRLIVLSGTAAATQQSSPAIWAKLTRLEHVVHALTIVGLASQALTSFGTKLLFGEMEHWSLLLHLTGAPLFMLGMAATAVLWERRCRLERGLGRLGVTQRLLFWVILVLGLIVMSAMLTAMLPTFGTPAQEMLKEIHEVAALSLLIVMIPHTAVSLAARRSKG